MLVWNISRTVSVCVYRDNGAWWYELVGRLDWVILLDLALYLPSASVFSVFMAVA